MRDPGQETHHCRECDRMTFDRRSLDRMGVCDECNGVKYEDEDGIDGPWEKAIAE